MKEIESFFSLAAVSLESDRLTSFAASLSLSTFLVRHLLFFNTALRVFDSCAARDLLDAVTDGENQLHGHKPTLLPPRWTATTRIMASARRLNEPSPRTG